MLSNLTTCFISQSTYSSCVKGKKKVRTRAQNLKKQVSVFASLKDRSWKDDGLRERKPATSTSGNSRPSAYPPQFLNHTQHCNGLQMHSHISASSLSSSPPPHVICSLPKWCRVTRMGKHLPRRKYTWTNPFTHTHTELHAECWRVSEQLMLHKANLDRNIFPKSR